MLDQSAVRRLDHHVARPAALSFVSMELAIRFTVADRQHLMQARATVLTPSPNSGLENLGVGTLKAVWLP
jgi:hypothetical protein